MAQVNAPQVQFVHYLGQIDLAQRESQFQPRQLATYVISQPQERGVLVF